jgi:hypothetical protein
MLQATSFRLWRFARKTIYNNLSMMLHCCQSEFEKNVYIFQMLSSYVNLWFTQIHKNSKFAYHILKPKCWSPFQRHIVHNTISKFSERFDRLQGHLLLQRVDRNVVRGPPTDLWSPGPQLRQDQVLKPWSVLGDM